MSTSPYFKCYPSDFLSGVAGLEADEIAVYTVVLMLIYDRSGPIAADYEHIGWRCRMRPSSARKVVARLVERGKLVLAGERLSNARAEKELTFRSDLAEISRNNGRKHVGKGNGEASKNKGLENLPASRQEPDTRSQIPEDKKNTPSLRSGVSDDGQKKVRSKPDDPEGFAEFWAAYPSRGDAGNPRKPARDKFAAAVKRGAKPEAIIAGAKAYAAAMDRAGKRGTEFVAQAATWLNQERWTDHAAPRQGDGSSVAGEISPRHQELKNQVWRMRVKDWLRDMHWPCTQESMPPDHPDTKVPDHILAEFNLTRRVRRPARPMLAVVGG